MQVLATWAPEDGILGAVAPLGLAHAQQSCLVVDLDEAGPHYPGDRSLADLVESGPTRADLEPSRSGLAILRNGGVGWKESTEVVQALVSGWPAVVLRLPASGLETRWPTVRVRPLLPGNLFGPPESGVVYQRSGWQVPVPASSVALPVPRPVVLAALLAGVRPPPSAWTRAWSRVWSRRWV